VEDLTVVVKKTREVKTHRGCVVVTTTRYDEKQKFLIEDIVLSHPEPYTAVAYSPDRIFDRMGKR
jgi:hypothetical protein